VSRVEGHHLGLLRVLSAHGVEYVLIGGVALQLHGYSANTVDVDVAIAVDDANTGRVNAALHALGAVPYLAGDRGSAYRTTLGQLEVMRSTDGIGDYSAWRRRSQPHDLGDGLVVQVGSANDLVASKEAAGREKDLAALPRIRAELLRAGSLAERDVRGPVAELPVDEPPDPGAEAILGPRPPEGRARGLWEHGAETLRAYRERWSITPDPNAPLVGAVPPAGDPRHSDRASVERQLQRTRRLLARAREAR